MKKNKIQFLVTALWIVPMIFSAQLLTALEVTVYNRDLGLIKENRTFKLKKGINDIKVTDIAAQIDPTSVHFKSLMAPDSVSVIEQNFQYDLISQEKLLERYLGKEIELERVLGIGGDKKELIKGTLLSNQGGRVMLVGGKIYVNPVGNPILPELPEGLLTKPTLLWKIRSQGEETHNCEISYLTSGMNWSADYVAATNSKDDRMDLNGWVTINNRSGATYKDAKLKLVAGDIHRSEERRGFLVADMLRRSAEVSSESFREKSFFEYHLYTLQRPTTLQENETKQIEMISVVDVPLKKIFIYDAVQNVQLGSYAEYHRTDVNYGIQGDKKVGVILEFKNSKENQMGIPLPKGRVRVYKKDEDGSLEFVGEDSIDHTPKNEKVRIKMGNAFDIVGERKRTHYQSDTNKRWFQESFEITLRNHKDEDIVVKVVEHLYRWTNWKILEASTKWVKSDAQTIEFDLPIKKDGETTITYSVKYSW